MVLIGLVRVTGDSREVEAQHELLDSMCSRVFEEDATRRRVIENRPQLLAVLEDADHADLIVVTKIRFLARTVAEGLEVLVDLVDRGVAVRVLGGAAAGDHTGPSFFLNQCREIVEIRRTILTENIKAGLRAARARGATLGRPRTVDDATYAEIVSRRAQGGSIRSIARTVEVSVGTVHNVLARAARSGQL